MKNGVQIKMNFGDNRISSKGKPKKPTPLEKLNREHNWQNGRLRGLITYLEVIKDSDCYHQACDAVYKQIKINNDNFEKQKREMK